jgi:hypothetical protein
VVLLLDEYLNSAPKRLELAKSYQPVRGQECGRCDGKVWKSHSANERAGTRLELRHS